MYSDILINLWLLWKNWRNHIIVERNHELLTSTLFLVKVTFFYPKQEIMVRNLKQEKPQRQRRRSTHDITESIPTFARRRNYVKMSKPVD